MDRTVGKAIAIILFFFISLFVYTKLAGPITFSVKSDQNALPFQTSGTGVATAVPDKASVSLGATSNASSEEEAKANVNKVINKVTSDLKSLGISNSDIKTTNFSVYPNFSSPLPEVMATQNALGMPAPNPASAFTANATIEVKTNSVEIANKAIDIASKDGATDIGGVNFTFDDAKQKDLENQARVKAIEDARQKAQILAKAAGIRLGRVTNISEDNFGGPMPMAANAKEGSVTADSTSLNSGETKVTINVTLTFSPTARI